MMFLSLNLKSNENGMTAHVTDRNKKTGATGNGDTVAQDQRSCGEDGRNMIHSLYDKEKNVNEQLQHQKTDVMVFDWFLKVSWLCLCGISERAEL